MTMPLMKTAQTVAPHEVAKQRRYASFTTTVVVAGGGEPPTSPTPGVNALPAPPASRTAATRSSDIAGCSKYIPTLLAKAKSLRLIFLFLFLVFFFFSSSITRENIGEA